MKTLLLLFLSLCLVFTGESPWWGSGDPLDGSAHVLMFRTEEGYVLQSITNPPNGFEFIVPDGQPGMISLLGVGEDPGIIMDRSIPSSGRWVMWSMPSDLTPDRWSATERTDGAVRAGLGFFCIGLGAVFFRCYKTGRSGT
jgi:hypothetical protein